MLALSIIIALSSAEIAVANDFCKDHNGVYRIVYNDVKLVVVCNDDTRQSWPRMPQ